MNDPLIEFLQDHQRVKRFIDKLPLAFETAMKEWPSGNPAIGVVRENIIIAYFLSEFGQDKVKLPHLGTQREYDMILFGRKLSLKTKTGHHLSGVKVIWTADQEKIDAELEGNYQPDTDLLLILIQWDQIEESLFYIPSHVQAEVFQSMGSDSYLQVAKGTNHRGITISTAAMKKLIEHPDTIIKTINWEKQGPDTTPYQRWEDFWRQE